MFLAFSTLLKVDISNYECSFASLCILNVFCFVFSYIANIASSQTLLFFSVWNYESCVLFIILCWFICV